MRLTGVALVFLALGLAAGFFLPGLTGMASLACPLDSQESLTMDQTTLSQEITDYLNANFLASQGLSASVTGLTEYSKNFFVVDFEIMEGDTILEQGQIYATRDGESILLGEVFDLDEALPPLDESLAEPPVQTFAKSDQPKVELYVMSFCPYGQIAEETLSPVVDLLGESIDVETHFIHYDNYCGWGVKCQATAEDLELGYTEDASQRALYCLDADEEAPQYCGMHGIDEVNENLRQMCVMREYPDKFWSYLARINQGSAEDTEYCQIGDDACWQAAMAAEGIDLTAIETCLAENTQAFVESEKALMEANGVMGSPTLIINGTVYQGYRTPEDYKNAICSAFNTAPAACGQELGSTSSAAASDAGCGA